MDQTIQSLVSKSDLSPGDLDAICTHFNENPLSYSEEFLKKILQVYHLCKSLLII
jgi:hypothetical protein